MVGSIISSAPTNSQFAGLLAGFVFTGILILFGRPGPKNTQALGLFCATFAVLGFDSYLFSLVSGGNTDRLCARVWSQAMPASGMLGVGAVALLDGIAWLLANHAIISTSEGENQNTGITNSNVNLGRLSRFMVYGVTIAVALLLAATSLDYLETIFGARGSAWMTLPVLSFPFAMAIVTVIAAEYRDRRTGPSPSMSPEVVTTIASYCLLGYAVAGPVFAGILTHLPESSWSSPPAAIAVFSLVSSMIIPGGLLLLLTLSAPIDIKPNNVDDSSRLIKRGTRRRRDRSREAVGDAAAHLTTQDASGTNDTTQRPETDS